MNATTPEPPRSPSADTVESVRAEVERLNTAELSFALACRKKAIEVSAERAQRGDRLLSATDPASAAQDSARRVAQLDEEQAAMGDGSRRARELRAAAIPPVWKAEADGKEQFASELLAQADAREAAANEFLVALEQATDWGWVPAQGAIDGKYFHTIPQSTGAFRIVDARGPQHVRLRREAAVLQSDAVQLRLRQTHRAGMVEGASVEDILTAVYSEPMRIGPPADSIIAWAAQACEEELRRRADLTVGTSNFIPLDAPITLHLEWRNGAIDAGQSGVVQPEPNQMAEKDFETYRREDAERVRARNDKYRNAEPRFSTPSGPGDTGPTQYEIEREAELTGKSIASTPGRPED